VLDPFLLSKWVADSYIRGFLPISPFSQTAVDRRNSFRNVVQQSTVQGAATRSSRELRTTVQSVGSFLARHLWIWPIIAITFLWIIGIWVHSSIVSTMKDSLRSEMQTLLQVETAMLETWLADQESNAESLANNINVRMMSFTGQQHQCQDDVIGNIGRRPSHYVDDPIGQVADAQ